MAKQINGYLGGFTGRLDTAVGYRWNGIWCLRRLPAEMRNPQTPKQMEHRNAFKAQVQLAATMRQAVVAGLTAEARQLGMTSYNLFMHLNQMAFRTVEGTLATDWHMLRLSLGPLAPVAFGVAEIDEHNTLNVSFEANPLHMRADGGDMVRLYAYCPALGRGYMTAPVYRRSRRISAALPDAFAGQELQLYGFVQNDQGLCSDSLYILQEPEEEIDIETGEVMSAPLEERDRKATGYVSETPVDTYALSPHRRGSEG